MRKYKYIHREWFWSVRLKRTKKEWSKFEVSKLENKSRENKRSSIICKITKVLIKKENELENGPKKKNSKIMKIKWLKMSYKSIR